MRPLPPLLLALAALFPCAAAAETDAYPTCVEPDTRWRVLDVWPNARGGPVPVSSPVWILLDPDQGPLPGPPLDTLFVDLRPSGTEAPAPGQKTRWAGGVRLQPRAPLAPNTDYTLTVAGQVQTFRTGPAGPQAEGAPWGRVDRVQLTEGVSDAYACEVATACDGEPACAWRSAGARVSLFAQLDLEVDGDPWPAVALSVGVGDTEAAAERPISRLLPVGRGQVVLELGVRDRWAEGQPVCLAAVLRAPDGAPVHLPTRCEAAPTAQLPVPDIGYGEYGVEAPAAAPARGCDTTGGPGLPVGLACLGLAMVGARPRRRGRCRRGRCRGGRAG